MGQKPKDKPLSSRSTPSSKDLDELRQPRISVLALVYSAFFATQSIVLLWMPTLLRNAGVAERTSLIFAAGAIGMASAGWSSDRRRERRWRLIACGAIASLALCLLPLAAGNPTGTTLVLAIAAPPVGVVGAMSRVEPR